MKPYSWVPRANFPSAVGLQGHGAGHESLDGAGHESLEQFSMHSVQSQTGQANLSVNGRGATSGANNPMTHPPLLCAIEFLAGLVVSQHAPGLALPSKLQHLPCANGRARPTGGRTEAHGATQSSRAAPEHRSSYGMRFPSSAATPLL
eukprot:690076-Amphidinium_carterae.1